MIPAQRDERDVPVGRPTNAIGGWCGPWLGAVMLAHLAFQLSLKCIDGRPEQCLWLSCAVLLIGGIGLLTRRALLIHVALTAGLMIHMLWVFDALCWLVAGSIPLGMVLYLPDADALAWAATSYHFYTVPVLLVVALRWRVFVPAGASMSLVLLLMLTLAGRALASPEANINCAYALSFGRTLYLIDAVNQLPGPLYLPVVSLGAWIALMMPVHLALGRWAAAPVRALPRTTEPSASRSQPVTPPSSMLTGTR